METNETVGMNQFTIQIDALGQSGPFLATAVSEIGADIVCLAVQDGGMKEQVSTRRLSEPLRWSAP